MPESRMVVDGIKSERTGPATRMFNMRDDVSAYHDETCQMCGIGVGQSPDAYRYIPGRTRTIYDREK